MSELVFGRCEEAINQLAYDYRWVKEEDGNVSNVKIFRQLDQAAQMAIVGKSKELRGKCS
jgi:hypothetical protein